ncbi:MAG: LysE family translocator, partial [Lysinibacillus sp.]
MEVSTVFAFLGAAIVLTLMPGPDNLFVLAQSIAQGKKAGIMTSFGLCTGLLVHIAATVLGVSAIIYQSTVVFTLVKYAGAVYLLYLAYQSFRAKGDPFTLNSQRKHAYMALYKRGIFMN